MTSPATKYTIGNQVEIRLPAGWRAGRVKRVIPNYTKSGGTVYEIAGEGFVSITSASTLRLAGVSLPECENCGRHPAFGSASTAASAILGTTIERWHRANEVPKPLRENINMETDSDHQKAKSERESEGAVDQPRLVMPLRRRSPLMGMLALTALAMMPGMGGGPLAADIRNDPDREKTPDDLERIATAQRKRERKAALRSRHNVCPHATASGGPNPT